MLRASPLLTILRTGAALCLLAATGGAQLHRDAPSALTDAEFWQVFSKMSEAGGSFPSENFVSNEVSFQYPIPTLQKTVRPDGVYLGVGPEQNFTYIANLKPRLAIIFDIRRQNAMAHLMYKAIFEMSPTRADFVSKLFARPLTERVASTAKVDDLFAVATGAPQNDSAYVANQRAIFATLVNKHHFVLTAGDSASIEHLLEVFAAAGPEVNYGYRRDRPMMYSGYPSYGLLQTRANADSVQMAFLATEDNYRVIRDMQLRNLIVPVVADFAGPTGIRAVGDFLKQRTMSVQAFYLSNVEQYLFQNGVADRFYRNVATLPIDSTSTFIRSVPPGGAGAVPFAIGRVNPGTMSMSITINGGVITRMQTVDSGGYRWLRATQDSGGVSISRLYRDSLGVLTLRRTDSSRAVTSVPMPNILVPSGSGQIYSMRPGAATGVVGAGLLASGIAPISKTIEAFNAGGASTYQDIIRMTKLDGWK